MRQLGCRLCAGIVMIGCETSGVQAQTVLTWQEAMTKFQSSNPLVQASQVGIAEARAVEITAYMRPNPQFAFINDQISPVRSAAGGQGGPAAAQAGGHFANLLTIGAVSYLHERRDKRELRLQSAQGSTAIAETAQADLLRNLTFALRGAFVQVLQAKAFHDLADANLANYDQVLALSRDRLNAGDIAQVDFDRLQLQRVQYEADVQTALTNLRVAKIQLLRLLNDSTPVDQFDVTGAYDFVEMFQPLDELRRLALDIRPDLQAALGATAKAAIDHRLAIANGSTDPTIIVDAGFPQSPESYTPPLKRYVGVGVSVPLRIFDRNQGEKLRTELEIRRAERLADAARTQVVSDVESAYATLLSTVALLRPYRATYLAQAANVRDTVTFSYQRGGTSLLDFLQAEQAYRSVQISYVNLIAAYLAAVAQLNFAIGQEVVQ